MRAQAGAREAIARVFNDQQLVRPARDEIHEFETWAAGFEERIGISMQKEHDGETRAAIRFDQRGEVAFEIGIVAALPAGKGLERILRVDDEQR
ncbi:MAG TPA: hypothetical protein VFN37_13425 [Candidatus Baltobacteraceae bacterium]|nr:hypothetical protein [Candidatus Baltobacteraceae bacterium]